MPMLKELRNALFGLALVVISSPEAWAVDIQDLVGKWNNNDTGENITFESNYDVQDSVHGQGRAVTTVEHGANYLLAYQNNIYCYYYITMTTGGMNLAVRDKSQSTEYCMKGLFQRAVSPQ